MTCNGGWFYIMAEVQYFPIDGKFNPAKIKIGKWGFTICPTKEDQERMAKDPREECWMVGKIGVAQMADLLDMRNDFQGKTSLMEVVGRLPITVEQE